MSSGRSGSTLEKFGQVALPPGAVRSGEVVDVDAVAAAISQLWAQAKFPTKRVVLGLANQKVVVRQVDLPWLPVSELKASLAFQVSDYIPMPVEQALLDFHPLEEFTADNGARMLRVLLVAAAREMVETNLAAVTKAGLDPVMVDLTPFAMLRSVAETDELGLASEPEALVEVGAAVTNIVVHAGGVPRFVRILLMGGADLTESVADRMGIPFDQAEALKQHADLSGPSTSLAEQVLAQSAGQLVDEIRGSLDYYLASAGSGRLSRILLSGGGAQLRGLDRRLAAATRLSVEYGSPLGSMKIGRTGLSPQQLQYVEPLASVPVGLAMGVPA